MATDINRLRELADHIMRMWNTQDVDKVLACYTDDLVYIDPNTNGPVEGSEALRRYLKKLFGRWTQTWRAGELFPLADQHGVTIRWTGTLAPVGSDRSIEIAGIDLVLLEGDLIRRNEVYFDRALLASAPVLA